MTDADDTTTKGLPIPTMEWAEAMAIKTRLRDYHAKLTPGKPAARAMESALELITFLTYESTYWQGQVQASEDSEGCTLAELERWLAEMVQVHGERIERRKAQVEAQKNFAHE